MSRTIKKRDPYCLAAKSRKAGVHRDKGREANRRACREPSKEVYGICELCQCPGVVYIIDGKWTCDECQHEQYVGSPAC